MVTLHDAVKAQNQPGGESLITCIWQLFRECRNALPTRSAAGIEIWCGELRIFAGEPVREYVALGSVSPPDYQKHWLARAEEARVISEQLTDLTAKRTLHKIAARYKAMAARAGRVTVQSGLQT